MEFVHAEVDGLPAVWAQGSGGPLLFNEDWQSAVEQFRIIDRAVTDRPWSLFGHDPIATYVGTRNGAFQKA
jgi:hypothetical protein